MLQNRISKSQKLASLSSDTVRLLYTWMLSHLDVNGNFYADPVMVNNLVFTRLGHSVDNIAAALDELEASGLIIRYQVGNETYLNYPDFQEKQPKINKDKEGKPDIPLYTPDKLRSNAGITPEIVCPKIREDKIREVKIREENTLSQKNKFLDSVFLTAIEYQKLQEVLGQKSLDVGIEKLDYSITVKSGKYKDHYKTLLNWFKRGFLVEGSNGNGSYQRGYKRNQERELPPDIAEAADARARKWLDAKNKAAASKT
jgi:hypothetical protein